jgi:hypothetical protein
MRGTLEVDNQTTAAKKYGRGSAWWRRMKSKYRAKGLVVALECERRPSEVGVGQISFRIMGEVEG